MAEGEDWLLRPVLEGLCRYESLVDGKLDLYDIALLNEALDIKYHNQELITEALEARRREQQTRR